ncbi:unnamed protein product [Hydatigera taeniaeformis]|uniref:TIR domain-containing protein n=1 Tax=Hydatigena taeniaeformis TaxID=6205 RepID=A0A0R3WTZ6_HYDTA|nr:unnamed protein product [Hydatigera taeniaeformis]
MYLSDGIRQIDYVIAFSFSSPSVEEPFQDFLIALLHRGFNIEVSERMSHWLSYKLSPPKCALS